MMSRKTWSYCGKPCASNGDVDAAKASAIPPYRMEADGKCLQRFIGDPSIGLPPALPSQHPASPAIGYSRNLNRVLLSGEDRMNFVSDAAPTHVAWIFGCHAHEGAAWHH